MVLCFIIFMLNSSIDSIKENIIFSTTTEYLRKEEKSSDSRQIQPLQNKLQNLIKINIW
jgi:hypothetical protein